MRRRAALLLVLGGGLGIGATALAQSGGSEDPVIRLHRGCVTGTRVTVRIVPASGTTLSPVHVRAGNRELVHLTGVTRAASVTVRVFDRGRVSVSGVTVGGKRFAAARNYRRCAPEPRATASPQPTPNGPVAGGGEG